MKDEPFILDTYLRDAARALYEELPIGMALCDSEGRVTECNHAYEKIIGISAKEIAGYNIFDAHNFSEEAMEKIRTQDSYEYDVLYHMPTEIFPDANKEPLSLSVKITRRQKDGRTTGYNIYIQNHSAEWQKFVMQKEMEKDEQLSEQLAIFDALADSYANVYLIDTDDETLKILKLNGYVTTGMDASSEKLYPYRTFKEKYVSERVHPDDQGMMLDALELAKVKKNLAYAREYTGNYRVLIDEETHYFQYKYVRLKNFSYIIAGFQNIDYIIAEHIAEEQKEIAHQKELNEQLAIINSLASNFRNVFVANLNDRTAKIIRLADDYDVEIVRKVQGKPFPFELLVNQWVHENVHPDDKERVAKAISIDTARKVFETQDEYVGTYRSLDGGKMHNYQYDVRKVDDAGNVVVGFQNIDSIIEEHMAQEKKERNLIEARLEEEREHAEVISALSTIYSSIFLADIETHRYEILNSVPLMGRVAGSKGNFDDVKEHILSAFMTPDMIAPMREFLDLDTLAERMKDTNTISTDYKDPEGRWFQARFIVKRRDEKGTAREILYVARETTKEKMWALEMNERLRNSLSGEQKQRTMLEALCTDYTAVFDCDLMHDTLSVVKLKESAHAYSNKEYTISYSEWIQRIYDEILIKDSEPDFLRVFDRQYLMDYLEKHDSLIIRHQTTPNRAGLEYFEVRVIPVYRSRNSYKVILAYRPIDDILRSEMQQQQQLASALAAAQQASKAKSTFLNSMSHDIRTPMNAIIGFTALAQTHLDNREQVQDYLEKISTSSTHLLSLINDILDMSRIESGTVKLEEKQVHIPDLLHDLRTMIQGLVNSKNLNLYIDTQDVVHEDVVTDKLRLNQVLINIVGNAIKFTKPGGDIIIRLVEKPSPGKSYTNFEFSVKDNGIGMSKEFVGHIFDTFSREFSSTVSGIQGTGLGMAITKNIVDMMGGEISVESELGKGSLFTVKLRLRLADHSVTHEPIPALLGARALVVDDDLNTCRSVSKMLRDIQMRPDWTASGKEAVIRAQDAAEMNDEYKVYIIDYLMPDMNGIETVRRIRKVISEEAAIIVLTAYDWTDFEHEAREAGVTAFVSKPIFMSELREVLTQPSVSESAAEKGNGPNEKKYDYTGKHILLVEDNELNREIATAILEETGMTIDSVNDGDVAVSTILEKPADTYDLILMDVQMPKMDGYTATREIRTLADNKKANIPIVAMTANAFDEDRDKAYAAGMNGHIIKPISIDAIARVLDGIFSGR